MLTQSCFEASTLARMHMGATFHKTVQCVQSETDMIGMETVDRSLKDKLFAMVTFTFKPNPKNNSNPLYDSMPMKLRLKGSARWLSEDRSDKDQRLSVKVLIE